MPFELRMALRYLTTRRREGLVTLVTLVCAAGVLVGVAALVLALALFSGLEADVRSRLLACNAHVEVRKAPGEEPFAPAEAEALVLRLEGAAGVTAAAPFAESPCLFRSRLAPAGRQGLLLAVDPAREGAVTGLEARTTTAAWQALAADAASEPVPAGDEALEEGPLDDEDLAAGDIPVVLLGAELALALGVTPGDVVHAVSASIDLSALGAIPRSRAYRVAGLLDTGITEYDQAWAIVSLARWRPEGVPLVDGVHLALAEPLLSAEAAGVLASTLPPNLVVSDWTTSSSRLFAAFRWEKLMMAIALGLISVVAGFNIFTILTMNVMARVVDVGVMSALGATRATLVRVFTLMGLAIGVAGTAAGMALGASAAVVLDRWRVIALDEAVYMTDHVSFRVEGGDLVVVAVGMVLVSLLATVVPSRAAAALDPLSALRAG